MKNIKRKMVSVLCSAVICAGSMIVPSTQAFAASNPTIKIDKISNTYSGVAIDWAGSTKNATYYIYRSDEKTKQYKNIGQTKETEYKDETVVDWQKYTYVISTQKSTPTSNALKSTIDAHIGTKITKIENAVNGIAITYVQGSLSGRTKLFKQEGTGDFDFNKKKYQKMLNSQTGVSTVYLDTAVDKGKTYSYIVGTSATNNQGKTFSIKYQPTTIKEQKISKFENYSDGIKIYFTTQPGISKYRVFKKEGKTWKAVGDSTTGSIKDKFNAKNQTNYTYTVRAINSDEKLAGPYNDTGFTTKYFSAVNGVTVANAADSQSISWNPVPGVEYYVPFVWWPSTKIAGQYEWTSIGIVKGNSAKFGKVVSGKTYKYTVRPADASKRALNYSFAPEKSVTFYTPPQMTDIKNTTKTDSKDNVLNGQQVSWNPVNGVSRYRLFTRRSANENWKKVVDTNALTYFNQNVENNTHYYYTVRGIDNNGKFVTGYNSYKHAQFYVAPEITGAQALENDILVSWTNVPGVNRYKVMMKNNNNGSDTNFTTLGYIERNYWYVNYPKEGEIYDFVIVCVDSKGNEISGWSKGMYLKYQKPVKPQEPVVQPTTPTPTPTKPTTPTPTQPVDKGDRIITKILNKLDGKQFLVEYYYKNKPGTRLQAKVDVLAANVNKWISETKTQSTYELRFTDGKKEYARITEKEIEQGKRIPTGYTKYGDTSFYKVYFRTAKTGAGGNSLATLVGVYKRDRVMKGTTEGWFAGNFYGDVVVFKTMDTGEQLTFFQYSDKDLEIIRKYAVRGTNIYGEPDYNIVTMGKIAAGTVEKNQDMYAWPFKNSNFQQRYKKKYGEDYKGKYYSYADLVFVKNFYTAIKISSAIDKQEYKDYKVYYFMNIKKL